MRLRAIIANIGVLLIAAGASGALHLLRVLGPECG
jgi:hypothetical protein